jgi:hypothetical protein
MLSRLSPFFCILFVVSAAFVPAHSYAQRRFGSNLRGPVNLPIGCEVAPQLDPLTGAPGLRPTGVGTCSFRAVSYIFDSTRVPSLVSGNGFVTRVRVKSGAVPAPFRVTILNCSQSLCGTAVRQSRVFRPRPNRVSTFTVNLRVERAFVTGANGLFDSIDAVAFSAVGPGSLPLFDQGTAGTLTLGSALTQLFYPAAQIGVPRVEQVSADGLELLFQWEFSRRPLRGRSR